MKAKIRWIIEFEYPVPDFPEGIDRDEFDELVERERWHLEQNYCQENYLQYLSDNSEKGICKTCNIGKVEMIKLIY